MNGEGLISHPCCVKVHLMYLAILIKSITRLLGIFRGSVCLKVHTYLSMDEIEFLRLWRLHEVSTFLAT